MKMYTRTGDGGATALFDGTRIAKSDPRVDAYGEVDEANATIGVVRGEGLDADLDELLGQVQRDLFGPAAHGTRQVQGRRRARAAGPNGGWWRSRCSRWSSSPT